MLASVSYTLGFGVQVEILSTDNNAGTTAINLTGNNLNQTIVGNAGANVITGGSGTDTLNGLGGRDTFVFNTAPSSVTNWDQITDFNAADDAIQLENIGAGLFNNIPNGALTASAFVSGAAYTNSTQRIRYNDATGDMFYDGDGNGGQFAEVQFAGVASGSGLTAADFFVV